MPRSRPSEAAALRDDAARPVALSRFAGYEVLGRLAVGGMAEVFLAREHAEGGSTRHVVLKVIRAQLASRPELAELFLQEGRVALGLTHPNICHTLRFGTEQGHPFLAMEHVAGVTLRELFARAKRVGRPLAPTVVAKIASTVAEALHSAHVAKDARGQPLGIVHQDVSPHNVMVAYDGTVKLLDFGVASTSKERAHDTVENSHVTVRGKTAYLSPEQCSGFTVDGRSDVFALGIVLYEMLTGARLFARASTLESLRAIALEPLPTWPASIPAPLRRVLDRALAQDRDDRYPSAAAMQHDLERFLADGRSVVTSAEIAEELERLLEDDFDRAPTLDTSNAGVAWLRSTADTLCEPIPLVKRRAPAPPTRTFASLLGVAAIAATLAYATDAVPEDWEQLAQSWLEWPEVIRVEAHPPPPELAFDEELTEEPAAPPPTPEPITSAPVDDLPRPRVMPRITVVAHEEAAPASAGRHRRRSRPE